MEVKESAIKILKGACRFISKDLNALPEEAFCTSFGKATRTVADIVFEVNLVTDHVGMVVRGEKAFDWPEERWIKAPADFCTKDIVVSAFEKSSQRIIETFEAFSEEQLTEPFQTEDGETTRFARCQFVSLHNWYHSGQLNFIQTILGDEEWHWMK